MRNVRNLCLLLIVCCSLSVQAQYYNQLPAFLKANSTWVFGKNVGMDFKQTPPRTFHGQVNSDEGCASVADPVTGELLFYTEGISCWNRNNMAMPNGRGLLGNRLRGTTAQGACIVPFVDSPGKYYLFSLSNDGSYDSTGYLYYSVVDMSLNNGLGDIEANRKNILIDSGLSEGMIAVPGNNCDVWLIVHTYDDPVFKAYHITSAGLDPVPVLSAAGYQISGREAYHIGQMAISPARDMIAVTSYHYHYGTFHGNPIPPPNRKLLGALVCRFDPNTGQASDAIQLENQACYGIGFSPDNSKLYVNVAYDPAISFGKINQYDLSVFDSAAIRGTRQEIHRFDNPTGKHCSFKTYRDTIYVGALFNYNALDRISNPNLSGAACNYEMNIVRYSQSGSVRSNHGLPNDVPVPFGPDTVLARHDSVLCDNRQNITLEAPAGMSAYVWDDQSEDPDREVGQTGTYWVRYRNGCHVHCDTFVVSFPDTSYMASDSFICAGGAGIQLTAPSGYITYLWDDQSPDSIRMVEESGIYWVWSYDYCHRRSDTFRVHNADIAFSLGTDTVICDNSSLSYDFDFGDATYLWQDGSSEARYEIAEPGVYSLTITKGTCVYTDSISVQYVDINQDLGPDTTVCHRQPFSIILTASTGPEMDILWSNGSTTDMITVHEPGIYWVAVSELSCSDTDTVVIHNTLCDCIVEMPTAFSPNGDGKNDRFRPVVEAGCTVRGFTMEVYNRWGQLVYTGTDFSSGWDGTWNGTPADIGAYFYTVRMEVGTEHHLFNKTGDVTLVR